MHLDLGPVMRSLRRQPAVLSLLILEIAAGVAAIGGLLISGAWYGHVGDRASGLEEENLVLAAFYSPRATSSSPLMFEQRESDRLRLRAVPGVQAVTALSVTSIDDKWSYPSLFRGRRAGSTGQAREATGWTVYADQYLEETLNLRFVSGAMPLLSGTTAVGGTTTVAPRAAVITRCLAERLFGSGTPGPAASRLAVGALLSSEVTDEVPIAGVVEDVSMRTPFLPHARCVAFVLGGHPDERESRYLVRVRPGQERAVVVAALGEAFAEDARRRYVSIHPFDSANSVSHRIGHGLVRMLAFFGGMVGLVALLGALAATSFLVAQRKRQIGIRRALGGTQADIVGYFLLESSLAVAVGSLLGVAGTVGLYLFMKRVFDSIPFDLGLLTVTLLVIWSASILATLIPALRAARVPPSVASRSL